VHAMLWKDLQSVLKSRPDGGVLSGRPLGNSANIQLWTPELMGRLHHGIDLAQRLFYPEFKTMRLDFARLVLCEAAQESTGDFRLNVRPPPLDLQEDFTSHGLIQVTPASVVKDYASFGRPIVDPLTKRIELDPATAAQQDLTDPCVNLLFWAWYTRNSVVAGVSMNEWAHRVVWHIPTGKVTRDFGNAQLTWLAGPHNDRHGSGRRAYADYEARMADYWVQAQFGSLSRFHELLDVPLEARMMFVADNNHAARRRAEQSGATASSQANGGDMVGSQNL